jgi:hypothetical protein
MPQESLDRADVIPLFKQMRGKEIPESMAGCVLDGAGFLPRFLYAFVDNPFAQVETLFLASL